MKPLPDMSRCSGSQSAEQQCLGLLLQVHKGSTAEARGRSQAGAVASRAAALFSGPPPGRACSSDIVRSQVRRAFQHDVWAWDSRLLVHWRHAAGSCLPVQILI